jgi:hypothetical protein
MTALTINETSWHCRLLKFTFEKLDREWRYKKPKTLCGYFWSFFFFNSILSIFWGIIVALTSMFTWLYALSIWGAFYNNSQGWRDYFDVISIFYGAFTIIFTVCLIRDNFWRLSFWFDGVMSGDKPALVPVKKSLSFISIVFGAIVATKKRFCPMVEYTS